MTVIVPGMITKSASVKNIFAPSAVTPGLKLTVSGSKPTVPTAKLPAAKPLNKPDGAEAVQVGVPVPKSPLIGAAVKPVGILPNVSVAEIVYPAFPTAEVKADKLL